MATYGTTIRRGLPRVPGGEPWPPGPEGAAPALAAEPEPTAGEPERGERGRVEAQPEPAPVEVGRAGEDPGPAITASGPVRRGLPRVPGGEPWPSAAFAARVAERLAGAGADRASGREAPAPRSSTVPVRPVPDAASSPGRAVAPTRRPSAAPEPERIGPYTRGQWVGAALLTAGALLYAAAMVVLLTRWIVSLDGVRAFIAAYPGAYPLPAGAPVGIPAWLGWQHFFNVFLLVLIIRSGWQVRTERRPPAYWAPRAKPRGRISLSLWFHQSLDLLWLVNGAIYVILLFATGQWMRIVPTSWDVFPHALSALLQYAALDWPTENGWVHYNALQQLSYFGVVFVAAPLAAITGFRMSNLWPARAKTLNRILPVEWARAVHFPVMIVFVLFIAVHVTLVLATGALRNLNHMYAAKDVVDWTGFWIFGASMLAIVAAWVAARPLVLAPVARLFGTVSGR
ncbi:hypothetical protein ASD19_05630 [Microbacterium sp. Root53]|uniref:cytochrome b/b6 domain-containing protein n=1 Tax=Microbacterium sp. Root53 TaxID=1736553 RepID=UPI0006FDE621|nr:cytochrome b/b6 domain-containing protein [Microbacterium sp. Root53]KQY98704.1 hypothetical protein ASD19_05630 [Microbacterium sp. Root53]